MNRVVESSTLFKVFKWGKGSQTGRRGLKLFNLVTFNNLVKSNLFSMYRVEESRGIIRVFKWVKAYRFTDFHCIRCLKHLNRNLADEMADEAVMI